MAEPGGDGGEGQGGVPVLNLIHNHANPYQRLLYSAPGAPLRLVPAPKSMIGRMAAEPPGLLHLHWDDRIFGRGEDRAINAASAAAVLDDLAAWKAKGGRILWTVHNRAAHADRDGETLAAARRRLAGLADLLHVHGAHAARHAAQAFGADPARIVVVPHPSYLGAYEPAAATLARPPAPGPRAFLHFGQLRAGKGSDLVVRAALALAGREGPEWRLRVAGKPFGRGRGLWDEVALLPQAEVALGGAPDEAIPALFGASHLYLAPFRELFTSGSVMLALGFGLPVIAPDTEAARETTPEACHDLLYPADGAPRRLLRAMARALAMPEAELAARRAACFAFAAERAPERVATAFAVAVLARIGEAP